jgi:hypothetical protein
MTYSGYNSGSPEMVFQPKTSPGSGTVVTKFHFKNLGSTGITRADVIVDGNVGIGAATPSEKLEVDGNVRITNKSVSQLFLDSAISSDSVISFKENSVQKSKIGWDASERLLAFVTGTGPFSSAQMVLKGSNVGIGTTAPTTKLDVNGVITATGGNSTTWNLATTNTGTVTGTGASNRIALWNTTSGLDSDANFNWNGTTLTVQDNLSPIINLLTTAASGQDSTLNIQGARTTGVADTAIINLSNNSFVNAEKRGVIIGGRNENASNTAGNDKMSLVFSFNDGAGTMIPNYTMLESGTFQVHDGDIDIQKGALALGVTPSATNGRIDASNDIVAFSSSDKNWKTNLKPIENPIEKIKQISGYTFDWIEESKYHGNSGHDVGVIAQEIELVQPEIVQTRESGMKAVKYDRLIPLLIETVKEQQTQIETLKEQVEILLNLKR